MPTYSVGASYFFCNLGYPKTSTSKGHKRWIYASFMSEGLGYCFLFYFPY